LVNYFGKLDVDAAGCLVHGSKSRREHGIHRPRCPSRVEPETKDGHPESLWFVDQEQIGHFCFVYSGRRYTTCI
jgi:hypothetical protein